MSALLALSTYSVIGIGLTIFAFVVVGFVMLLSQFYRKVGPEEAIVRTGYGGRKGHGQWRSFPPSKIKVHRIDKVRGNQ